MPDKRIILSATWIVVMLIYPLADTLFIFSSPVARGIAGLNPNPWIYLMIAVLMPIPILMVFPTLLLL